MLQGGASTMPAKSQSEKHVPTLFRGDRTGLQWTFLVGIVVISSERTWGIARFLLSIATVLAILLPAAAVWQAMQPGAKFTAHSTPVEVVRMLLQLFGDILLIPMYAWQPAEQTQLHYQSTPDNLQILAECPTLQSFKQTPWLRNTLLSFATLMWGDAMYVPSGDEGKAKVVRREKVVAPDGGIIALDWWEEEEQMHMIKQAKRVLLIGSTFTGDAFVTAKREICMHFTRQGWRCVVLTKRGCGFATPNTQLDPNAAPWCLGGHKDTELAIDHVAQLFPGLPICGLGLSTGAGHLRNYVHMKGDASKLAAAVLIDAAPEWEWALSELDQKRPLIAKALAIGAQITYRACGHSAYSNKEGCGQVMSGGLMEFVRDWMAPAHGYEPSDKGAKAYMRSCELSDPAKCKIPTLEMLTINDSLISPEMIKVLQQYPKDSPNIIVATTVEGTHMVRWEGWKPRCWLALSCAEFLDAALQQRAISTPIAPDGPRRRRAQPNQRR